MARNNQLGSGSTGVVAIFAIVMLVLIGGFLAFRAGVFGGGGSSKKSVDINVNTPAGN